MQRGLLGQDARERSRRVWTERRQEGRRIEIIEHARDERQRALGFVQAFQRLEILTAGSVAHGPGERRGQLLDGPFDQILPKHG